MTKKLEFKSEVNCSASELFEWHASPGALMRLTPYWEPVTVVETQGVFYKAIPQQVGLEIKFGPLINKFQLEHINLIKGQEFTDVQINGPFAKYQHNHSMADVEGGCLLVDRLEFSLPFAFDSIVYPFIRDKFTRLFRYRHELTKNDIQAAKINKGDKRMKVLISGASGLVGKQLSAFLLQQGHDVYKLVRSSKQADPKSILWDPSKQELDPAQLEGFDAVVNLSGENIANKRWTVAQKAKLRDSRINATKLLAGALAGLKHKPQVFISASAIGFYGDRPGELLDETSNTTNGDFLADTCKEWEAAANPARDSGIRVVHPRFGVILAAEGGALSKLLLPFQLGLGGLIGNGKQVMSWIALDDVVYGLYHLLCTDAIEGAVNFTSPEPVTNKEFTKVLGKVLFRPTLFPLPAFVARIILGEMADALLLASADVRPQSLLKNNYKFAYSSLEAALRQILGR